MASTDSQAACIRPLSGADLSGCLALSLSAGWNQNEQDWRMMLDLGQGWGIEGIAGDGTTRLAASTVVIPYAKRANAGWKGANAGCAWVSMVLVLPGFRRLGHASRLLRHSLAHLKETGATPVLDATPAGYPVYIQEGFEPTWGFRRYRREALSVEADAANAPRTRLVTAQDWPAIMAYDSPAFGADREQLLRRLANRMPQAARIAERDGRITGLVFGRDGRQACQIGPMLADDAATAQALFDDVLNTLGTPVHVDLADCHLELLQGLVARGFQLQRPFTRMVHGAPAAPGNPARVVLVAGPELG